jgi:beta-phosphoglucomutase-like phosphatase (HAD superfamily)
LKLGGRRVALATDCAKDEMKHYLSVTESETLVDAIACGDDVKRGKPAPSVVNVALRRVRARRTPAVLGGDTPFDAKAARRAGVTPLGVLSGTSQLQMRFRFGH